MRKFSRTRKGLAFVAVSATAVVTIGGVALATHVFSDVGDTDKFAEEIHSIANAGITTGYSDGRYGVGDDVSREAMAAFMERGFGRVEADTGGVGDPAAVAIEAGATVDGSGYVLLTATWTATDTDSGAGDVTVAISDGTTTLASSTETVDALQDASGAASAVQELAADATGSYTATITGAAEAGSVTLVAQYIPFDGDADAPPAV